MGVLVESSAQSKVIVAAYLVGMTVQAIGTLEPHWGTTYFVMPSATLQTVYASAYFGIFHACAQLTMNTTHGLTEVGEICVSKPSEDWQTALVLLALFAVSSSAVGLVLVVLNVVITKIGDRKETKLGIAITTAFTSLILCAAVTNYVINEHTTVDLSGIAVSMVLTVDWAVYVTALSALVYAGLSLFLFVDIYIKRKLYDSKLCFRYSEFGESEPLRRT